ncbi:MAG: hypothetical protein J6563_08535, partial [Gilliamella sp.]|uniref:hypothetical protein n=1 Tax=Gilliamella sp. TaxID=1891236 RepID=UPI00261E8B5E
PCLNKLKNYNLMINNAPLFLLVYCKELLAGKFGVCFVWVWWFRTFGLFVNKIATVTTSETTALNPLYALTKKRYFDKK